MMGTTWREIRSQEFFYEISTSFKCQHLIQFFDDTLQCRWNTAVEYTGRRGTNLWLLVCTTSTHLIKRVDSRGKISETYSKTSELKNFLTQCVRILDSRMVDCSKNKSQRGEKISRPSMRTEKQSIAHNYYLKQICPKSCVIQGKPHAWAWL